jgi:hypothetical protein
MARRAKCDQVLFGVVARVAAKLFVVDRGLIFPFAENPRFIVPMTSTSCVAQRSARPIIELQLLLKFLRNG